MSEGPHDPGSTVKVLRRALRVSVVLTVTCSLLLIAGIWVHTVARQSEWLEWAWFGSAGVCLLSGLGLAAHSAFVESRIRLIEVIATVWVAGAVLAALFSWRNLNVDHAAGAILLGLLPTAMVAMGSVWGWRAAEALGEQRTWPRLGLLACGWLAIPAVISGGMGLVFLLMEPSSVARSMGCMSCAGVGLLIPAVLVERAIRRRRAAAGG